MKFRAGTIGIAADYSARYTDFLMSMTGLKVPEGTEYQYHMGADVANNCNEMVRNIKGDWLWIMGDDHAFEEDILMKLLEHDKDVVVPLCVKKHPPWEPVLYSKWTTGGYESLSLKDLPRKEMFIEVAGAGTAGMLVKRHVFDQLEDPWFEYGGEHSGVRLGEDLFFCRKLNDLGIKIYADLSLPLGHIRPMTILAQQDLVQGWGRSFQVGGDRGLFLTEG